jgi:beta-glucoside operon transcriptional antiterminator
MKCIRSFNNNIILADDGGKEVIVLGRGIGYNAAPGAEVNGQLVQKIFVARETAQMSPFRDVLPELPYEQIILASKIVDFSREKITGPLNHSIVITLADHLSFAFRRLAERLDIKMPLLWDIKHIYPVEFAVGEKALEIIREETGTAFPHEEAAAIALHFVNAGSETQSMSNTIKTAAIIKDVITIIERYFDTTLNEESYDFIRFVTHLRNTILRFITQGEKNPDQSFNDRDLYFLVRERYQEAWECCRKISEYLKTNHGINPVWNDESFLTLYIRQLTERKGKKKL